MSLSKSLPQVSGNDMSSRYHSTNVVSASQHKCPLDLPWLEEIHSKIWSRNDLERDLFRKVEVTQAHYAELQKRLNSQHLARDLPKCDGGQLNVRSVKLDFLRSITPLLPRHGNNEDLVDDDDGPEASNEDSPEVGIGELETSSEDGSEMDVDELETSNEDGSASDSFFPFALSFLDLSPLGLKESVPKCFSLPLFIRQEYDHISALIETRPRNGQGSVVITGQPGTGEALVSLYHRV